MGKQKLKTEQKPISMITITTHEQQFEMRLKFSTGWIKRAANFITSLLSFEEIRAIEQRKQDELHRARLDFLKMN